MSERLWFIIDTVIDETETEVRKLEDKLETLTFHYEIAVVKEAAIRLAKERPDTQLVDVKVLKREIHRMRNQITTKQIMLEDLSRLKEEAVQKPGFREELVDRLNTFKQE